MKSLIILCCVVVMQAQAQKSAPELTKSKIDTTVLWPSNARSVVPDTVDVLVKKIGPNAISAKVLSISNDKPSWRLVHDGKRAINIFYANGQTYTRNTLEIFKTQDELWQRVKTLPLAVDSASRIDTAGVKAP